MTESSNLSPLGEGEAELVAPLGRLSARGWGVDRLAGSLEGLVGVCEFAVGDALVRQWELREDWGKVFSATIQLCWRPLRGGLADCGRYVRPHRAG